MSQIAGHKGEIFVGSDKNIGGTRRQDGLVVPIAMLGGPCYIRALDSIAHVVKRRAGEEQVDVRVDGVSFIDHVDKFTVTLLACEIREYPVSIPGAICLFECPIGWTDGGVRLPNLAQILPGVWPCSPAGGEQQKKD